MATRLMFPPLIAARCPVKMNFAPQAWILRRAMRERGSRQDGNARRSPSYFVC